MNVDTEATTGALHDLRQARRHNRIQNIHWIDALYRVYVTALVGAIAVIFAAGKLPDEKLSQASLDKLVDQGPAALGLLIAVAVAFGLRSGGRGGPLTLEAAAGAARAAGPGAPRDGGAGTGHQAAPLHGLLRPVVGRAGRHARRSPAPRQHRGPDRLCAATGALIAALAVGSAMIASGRRIGWWLANGIARR